MPDPERLLEDAEPAGIVARPVQILQRQSNDFGTTYQTCFRMILGRCDPNIRGRISDGGSFGLTILHSIAGSRDHVTAEERVAFATMLLDAGARLDLRDHILKSTPLGWACRWGRLELVKLYLDRGADAVEADGEAWARPVAWARKKRHAEIEVELRKAGAK